MVVYFIPREDNNIDLCFDIFLGALSEFKICGVWSCLVVMCVGKFCTVNGSWYLLLIVIFIAKRVLAYMKVIICLCPWD